jgi:hypothetical protein
MLRMFVLPLHWCEGTHTLVYWRPLALRYAEVDQPNVRVVGIANTTTIRAATDFSSPRWKKGIERMNLNDSSNRQGSDLHKCEPSEVAGFQNVDHAVRFGASAIVVFGEPGTWRPFDDLLEHANSVASPAFATQPVRTSSGISGGVTTCRSPQLQQRCFTSGRRKDSSAARCRQALGST